MPVIIEINLDPSITPETYLEVGARLMTRVPTPDGMIAHTGAVVDDRIRVIDVWESEDHFSRFEQEYLVPAIAEVAGGDGGPAPTSRAVYETLDLQTR